MKLLLTSAGIQNKSIARAILELTNLSSDKVCEFQSSDEVKLAFIPTAANAEAGDKDWLIDDLRHFQEQNYDLIDIVDIAALSKEEWIPRLEAVDVICFGGGDEQYLARILRESESKKYFGSFLRLGFIWATVPAVWLPEPPPRISY